jgi:hypothetical protein
VSQYKTWCSTTWKSQIKASRTERTPFLVVTPGIKSRASQPRTHAHFTQVPPSQTKSFSTLPDKSRRAGTSLLVNSKRRTALRHSSNRLSESPRSAAAANKIHQRYEIYHTVTSDSKNVTEALILFDNNELLMRRRPCKYNLLMRQNAPESQSASVKSAI